ncbi:MAG: hypothetical protein RIM23_29715 [Coleofasciculus sp. G3-WIS-01]|uniref:hypothetical protein n=1 Tax=Coleofasciculus sp. G3-WIS-01 TaxID=3069528 RepID=UPI0032FE8BD5
MNRFLATKTIFWSKIFLLKLLFFGLFLSKAQAGGGSQPIYPESRSDPSISSILATPNWQIWSKPYWLNGNICRENQASLVCLTPKQAQENRWLIPSAETQEANRLSKESK